MFRNAQDSSDLNLIAAKRERIIDGFRQPKAKLLRKTGTQIALGLLIDIQ